MEWVKRVIEDFERQAPPKSSTKRKKDSRAPMRIGIHNDSLSHHLESGLPRQTHNLSFSWICVWRFCDGVDLPKAELSGQPTDGGGAGRGNGQDVLTLVSHQH